MATKIGFFLKFLDIEAVGATVEFPIDMADTFAGIVLTVFGELHRETMKRAFVQACDKALHHLGGKQLQRGEGLGYLSIKGL